VTGLRVNSAAIPDGQTISVKVDVITSAQQAQISATGGTVSGGSVTLEVGGLDGTTQLSFTSGTTISSIVDAINAQTDSTGVYATVSGANFNVRSLELGSDAFVSLKTVSGTYAIAADRDTGRDATVAINGATASTDGIKVSYRTGTLDIEFELAGAGFGFNTDGSTKTFGITGGGATFALGSKVTFADRASIGIGSVSTSSLGDSGIGMLATLASGQTNAINGSNLADAQKVLDAATKQVTSLRGRLGAFQKFTIGSTVNSLGVAYENAAAAESAIRDTDFAEETANLTRSQILSQAAQSVLSQANASPQAALALLR
jgi:flagellin